LGLGSFLVQIEATHFILYQNKSAQILYNIIEAREKWLSQAKPDFQLNLWFAVVVLYFSIAVLLLATARGGWRLRLKGKAPC
jgi:hypothetical protein